MRSLNLDQLKAFVEVVERGSFTAAAKDLNLTQPAVTHQVQELERRFQVTLVERFGKRAYLTQAGEKLIVRAAASGRRCARADGDAQAQRRLARPGPRRYERDRSHVCAAANPAKAQDRPSATRNQPQNTFDRDDLGNAQDERARPGGVCPTRRGSGVRDDLAVRG